MQYSLIKQKNSNICFFMFNNMLELSRHLEQYMQQLK